ncbi:MAG: rane fusion protein heavy metal efflux system [Pyrinomonadaceae bacterium]|jgi:RND family efflux transporter MFP subunit|nr:rane fusion protein heavy metal efflux system [Pyrinomonadaceae bacterium]
MNKPEEIKETASAANNRRSSRSRTIAMVAVLAVVAAAAIALLLWLLVPRGNAGRPVPAPRNIGTAQPSNQANAPSGESTLTLAPEQAQRAGIKIELVGERASGEASGQQTTGVVQANAYRETPVMSLVGGIVRSVGPELGQSVRKGQTVAVVASNDLADAQTKYLAAFAELEEHHKHHARTEKLVVIGAASREELELATSKLKAAESELANLRQRLMLLGLSSQRVSALRSTSQVSSEVSLPSPASGTVTNRTVNSGEVIEANKELLRVTDLSSVWVVAQVYEKDLGKVHIGSGASITTDAYPGRVFRGQISYVDPKVELQTRTAQARIELANPGQQLKIGMYVNVAFAALGGTESSVPIVPLAAVQNMGNRQVIFLATSDPGVFAMRFVRLGPESNGYYPVLEGLSVGDRIVTAGSFLLRAEWLKSHPNG